MQLKTNPPKGTADWFPEEYRIRKYIFDTWRSVCQSYGFEEYLGPLVENTEIWKAKSGEDVGGSELTRITNKDGDISELALRPEMTPTVTRMVSRVWKEKEKPLKWFSIANFYRNERPQKGRNREFWQLNADIFGEDSINADIETLCLVLDLMLAFEPPKGSFKLNLNHRGLIDHFFESSLRVAEGMQKTSLMRLLDKYQKLKPEVFHAECENIGMDVEQIRMIEVFMGSESIEALLENFPSFATDDKIDDLRTLIRALEELGYGEYIGFSPSLIRGFDYYDGVIFEMFDTNPENNRSLFGGGRYNGLGDIFGVKGGIPAIGFGPGDETMKLFLEGWNLIDNIPTQEQKYYIPLLDSADFITLQNIAKTLRMQGKQVVVGTSIKKLAKAVAYADKQSFSHVIIYGESEKAERVYSEKCLQTGDQITFSL